MKQEKTPPTKALHNVAFPQFANWSMIMQDVCAHMYVFCLCSETVLFCSLRWSETHHVAQVGLRHVTIYLPQPLESWNSRHEPSCLVKLFLFSGNTYVLRHKEA